MKIFAPAYNINVPSYNDTEAKVDKMDFGKGTTLG